MTYEELLQKFLEERSKSGQWSPFDRIEIMAMQLFAKWLDKQAKKANQE